MRLPVHPVRRAVSPAWRFGVASSTRGKDPLASRMRCSGNEPLASKGNRVATSEMIGNSMFGEYDRPSSHSRVQAYLFGRSTKSLFHMITESRGREWGARIFIRNRTSYRATKDEMKSEHEAADVRRLISRHPPPVVKAGRPPGRPPRRAPGQPPGRQVTFPGTSLVTGFGAS